MGDGAKRSLTFSELRSWLAACDAWTCSFVLLVHDVEKQKHDFLATTGPYAETERTAWLLDVRGSTEASTECLEVDIMQEVIVGKAE